MSMVHDLYCNREGELKAPWSARAFFLKGKHKWTNPDSTLQRRNRLLGTDEEPEHFGDDDLPRPPGLQRLAKSQRTGSNSTASSGSNPATVSRIHGGTIRVRPQSQNDRAREKESEETEGVEYHPSQRIAEDMRVLQIDTRGWIGPTYAAIINAQKARIRAAYPPHPSN
ncbi:hypothetical protein Tco_1160405 [Tanacetum coccineum]